MRSVRARPARYLRSQPGAWSASCCASRAAGPDPPVAVFSVNELGSGVARSAFRQAFRRPRNAPPSAQLRLVVGALAPPVVALSERQDHPQLKYGERERPYDDEPDCEDHHKPAPEDKPAACRCERADDRQRNRGET